MEEPRSEERSGELSGATTAVAEEEGELEGVDVVVVVGEEENNVEGGEDFHAGLAVRRFGELPLLVVVVVDRCELLGSQ